MPVVGFDGTRLRHSRYKGVILSLVGRDGNGQNVTLATAFVHLKNKDNIVCFFFTAFKLESTSLMSKSCVMVDTFKVL